MAGLEILPVRKRSEFNEFVDLPWRIYQHEPNWVPPLKRHVKHLLDPTRHPFWEFAERELFLARKDGKTVGRIAGIVDPNYNVYHKETSGAWGFLECDHDPEAAAALFSAAEHWVRGKGMTYLRGPFNPSTNYEIGTLIEGFQYPPVIMMTYNPRYYPELIEASGYAKEKDLLALWANENSRSSERVARLARRIQQKHEITIRPGNPKDIEGEARLMNELYSECWAGNWGFVPMSQGEIKEMAKNLKIIADPDLVFFPSYKGEAVGVGMLLPDVNPLLTRLNGRLGLSGILKVLLYKKRDVIGLRGVLFGIKKPYQKFGVSLVAVDYVNRVAREKKYQYIEFGWNLEDNAGINQFDQEVGARIHKRYRIYGKSLS